MNASIFRRIVALCIEKLAGAWVLSGLLRLLEVQVRLILGQFFLYSRVSI